VTTGRVRFRVTEPGEDQDSLAEQVLEQVSGGDRSDGSANERELDEQLFEGRREGKLVGLYPLQHLGHDLEEVVVWLPLGEVGWDEGVELVDGEGSRELGQHHPLLFVDGTNVVEQKVEEDDFRVDVHQHTTEVVVEEDGEVLERRGQVGRVLSEVLDNLVRQRLQLLLLEPLEDSLSFLFVS